MASLQSILGTIGDDTLTTDLVDNFVVDGLDGDDTITVEETASAVEIQAGKGEDRIIFSGDISNSPKIKGGANADVFDIQGTVTGSSIYGGKAGDSIKLSRTISSAFVSGDTGSDTITINNKVHSNSVVDGGEDDDLITVNERITESTILGGGARDTIDINDNSESAVIKLGAANDVLTITGKHGSTIAKGNGGDDTITVESLFSGSSNTFYGGKGEDNLILESTAKVTLIGDKDDDTLSVGENLNSEGATLRGGDGNDTVSAALSDAAETPKFAIFGDQGDDSLVGSTGLDTIRGGQGNDTITAANGGGKNFYGDIGDDDITLLSQDPSLVSGDKGDDTITSEVIANANSKAHSIDGGAGVDSITVSGVATGLVDALYAADTYTTLLQYDSLSEFISGNEVVDSITYTDTEAVTAVISGKLKITKSDDFSRIQSSHSTDKKRTADTEGLRLATAASITGASSVKIDSAADDYIAAIDLSAGTTGNSTIDASEANTRGMALIGGSGRDTILGGDGADAITGNAGADSLEGGDGNDHIYGGAGIDTIKGGEGADTIEVLGSGLQTADDVIDAGNGSDGFNIDTSADAVTAEFDMDNISNVLNFDTTAGNLATITFSAISETTSQIVDYTSALQGVNITNNAASSTTKFKLTGSTGADTLKGSNGDDTIIGGGGADSLFGGDGNDTFTLLTAELFDGSNDLIPAKIDGGAGSADVLNIGTAGFSIVAADIFSEGGGFTGIEKIVSGDSTVAISLELGLAGTQSGITTIDLSADAITTNDNKIDVSDMTVTGSGAVDFLLKGGAGAEDIDAGTGDDTLFGGLSDDTLTGGAGADRFILTSGLTIDQITDFTIAQNDILAISISALETAGAAIAGQTLDIVQGDGTGVAAGDTPVVKAATGATTLDAASNIVNYGTAVDDAAALETSLENSGNGFLTFNSNVAVNDALLVQYTASDSTQRLALVQVTGVGGQQVNAVEVADIAVWQGGADLAADEYIFIA